MFVPLAARARRAVSALITLGLLSSVLILSPTPALAASEPAFGTMFHALWSDYSDGERDEVLDKLASANIRWVRVDIGWTSLMEKGRGQISSWYLDRLESVVDAAQARGIEVLGMLFLTPPWANGGASKITPPDDAADFGDAAGFLAGHFKGRVAAWEVWNEPNHKSFWNGSAADYTRLLKASYPAIKSADPSAQVVLGGPSYNDTTWLSKVYEAGAQGFFDVMSTHPYQGIADAPPEKADDGTMWTLDHVGAVHDLMKKYGDGDKKIWFTEFGWSTHGNWSGVDNWDRGVTEAQQADFAIRTLDFLEKEHPYVTHVFWYTERNRDEGDAQLDNYGLLRRDLSEKPVFKALREHLASVPGSPEVPEAPVVEPVEDTNLLSNGDFEDAEDPWQVKRGRLQLADGGIEGQALAVKGRRVKKVARSESVTIDRGEWLTLESWLRGTRTGQRVKVVVVEKAGDLVVRTWSIQTLKADWTAVSLRIPRRAAEASDLKVKFKMLSGGGAFALDSVSLSTL